MPKFRSFWIKLAHGLCHSLAEGTTENVQIDAIAQAAYNGEVDLRDVRRQLLGLHDASRRLLHRHVRLLQHTTAGLLNGAMKAMPIYGKAHNFIGGDVSVDNATRPAQQ